MPTMTEAYVDERGILRVPLVPHTCGSYHDAQHHVCQACAEMVDYWAAFDAMPMNVRLVPATEVTWDTAHDGQVYEEAQA